MLEPMYAAARDAAEDITLAVELKFLVRQDLSEVRSRYGNVRPFVPHRPEASRNSMTTSETQLQRDNWEAIARVINAIPGVSATTSHELQAQSLGHAHYWKTHWIVYKANSAAPLYLTYLRGDPDRPLLDTTASDYEKYAWTPVEISSPILPWAQKEDVVATLGHIIGTLNAHFDVVSNATTEVHVHAGRADGRFYSLETMKKLATLLWLSEPLLRAVKDPDSPNFHHHYTWSYSWREQSRIARLLASSMAPGGSTVHDLGSGRLYDFERFVSMLRDPRLVQASGGGSAADSRGPDGHVGCPDALLEEHGQALGAIWRAADHKELGHMLRGPERKFRRLGFNFHALEMDDSEPAPRTVEVRFLEGFIDKEVVPAWMRLCGELVDLATEQAELDWDFYDAVSLLLVLPREWPLDAQFAAFMSEMGRGRVPKSVYEPLRAVIRKNHPPSRAKDGYDGSRWYL